MKNAIRPFLTSLTPAVAAAITVALTACGGADDGQDAAPEDAVAASPLLDPEAIAETAPESFQARFETTKGTFVVDVTRAWSPNGADRFYTLVKNGFYDDVRVFRVIEGFVAQFGLHGDQAIQSLWSNTRILDDPVVEPNTRGAVTFAKTGRPHSRTVQVFVNLADNTPRLDTMGFAPFGRVTEGMEEVVDQLYAGYGNSVSQPEMMARGYEYLDENFPELDRIISATVVDPAGR